MAEENKNKGNKGKESIGKIRSGIEDFKNFAMKGNVLDLAIGVIIGGAFGKIVTSLVGDIIMPFIGLLLGRVNLSSLHVALRAASGDLAELDLNYGLFVQNIVDFLIIALSIYFFIKFIGRFKRKQETVAVVVVEPTKSEELLGEIRDLLKDRKG
jgi:large conductance mechanosensitive channel